MFIYKILVKPLNQVYIGLDTNPEYKQSRWKTHIKASSRNPKTKLHKALATYGVEKCEYSVLEKGFTNLSELAVAEVRHIKTFNSYRNGLNSTPGGDGLGKHDLTRLSEHDITIIRELLGESFREYNKKKWLNTDFSERQKLTSHLHTESVYEKRTETLKQFYAENPDVKLAKGKSIQEWQQQNKDTVRNNNIKNGLLGAAKMSKPVTIESETGKSLTFASRSELQRKTGLWFSTLLEKSLQGVYHKGYRVKG